MSDSNDGLGKIPSLTAIRLKWGLRRFLHVAGVLLASKRAPLVIGGLIAAIALLMMSARPPGFHRGEHLRPPHGKPPRGPRPPRDGEDRRPPRDGEDRRPPRDGDERNASEVDTASEHQ